MNPRQEQTCPNCVGRGVRTVFRLGATRVVRCTGCTLQFAASYPEIEQVGTEMYGADYFERALQELPERRRIFGALLAEVEGMLGRRGRLLDVGAGEGTLLRVAAERGWEVVGLDVAGAMVQHVRRELGLPMHQGTLDTVALPASSFDAVILNHVLEHVRDPVTTLRRVGALLVPGGLVRLEVPNLASLSSQLKSAQSRLRLKRSPWKHYSTDHHFWFFTPATLRRTIATAGLWLVHLAAPRRQWGGRDGTGRGLYARLSWGKHIVAYATVSASPTNKGEP